MAPQLICTKCKTPIILDNIDSINGCNEEGEDYGTVKYDCDCGKDYEFYQWGNFDSREDAVELFTDTYTEYYPDYVLIN